MKSFLKSKLFFLCFLFFVSIFLYAFLIEPQQLQITHYTYSSKKIQKSFKIAFISDTHTGSIFNDLERLNNIVSMTNAQKPDLVLLGGDFVVTDVLAW